MVQSRNWDVFKNHLSESKREQTFLNSDSSHNWVNSPVSSATHHFLSYIIFFLTKNYQTVVLTELWEDLKYMVKKILTQMIFKYPFTYKK